HFAQSLFPGRLDVVALVERAAALIFDNQPQAEESPFQLIDVVGPIHRSMFPAMRRSLFQGTTMRSWPAKRGPWLWRGGSGSLIFQSTELGTREPPRTREGVSRWTIARV